MIIAIFETALYWQDVNAIYNLNAEINANVALIDNTGTVAGAAAEAGRCKAFNEIIDTGKFNFEGRVKSILPDNLTYTTVILDGDVSKSPFAIYQYQAGSVTVGGVTKPRISLWVDCRSPFERGCNPTSRPCLSGLGQRAR